MFIFPIGGAGWQLLQNNRKLLEDQRKIILKGTGRIHHSYLFPIHKETFFDKFFDFMLKILLYSQIAGVIIIIFVLILGLGMKIAGKTCNLQPQGYERWDKKQIP